MRSTVLAVIASLSALALPHAAHADGPVLDIRLGDQETAIHGYTYLESYTLHACAGGTTTLEVDGNVDLASGFAQSVAAGGWCSVDFAFGDELELVYNGPNGLWSDWVELGDTSIEIHPIPGSGFPPVLRGVYGGNPVLISTITP